ncbi:MAG TPA: CpsB/CapC family capsule biosynthesis tyrosine phosphatase [Chitinophagaceae bacterium]|nr:CpsB/CapC family capsule biosynthesis tyrosine phosphatase [Chitinophagaceae bacterium]
MLQIFRKKQSFSDTIEEGLDIHCHILPGIDDGAQDVEKSILLINGLQSLNINQAIATPHIMRGYYENDWTSIHNASNALRNYLISKSTFKFQSSAEYMLDENFEIELNEKSLLTHPNNYVLIEMSYAFENPELEKLIFRMQSAGYRPIMAHPERYNYWPIDYNIQKLINRGVKFQLNALSLSKYYGTHIQKKALKWLREDVYTFIGTDMHHTRHLEALKELKINAKDFERVKELWVNNKKYLT